MNKNKILVLLFTIIVFITGIIINFDHKKLIFKLKGNNIVKLELNEEYEDSGFVLKLCHNKKCEKLEDDYVSIKENVDISKVGTYDVYYKLKYIGDLVLKRKIEVVDTTNPVIELIGDNEVVICPNSIYEENGFVATDNYDGDITSNVKVEKVEDGYRYSVSDSSNNIVEVFRKIKYEDIIKPEIILNGKNNIVIDLNGEYK